MIDDVLYRIRADETLTDFFVPVFVRTHRIFRIVQVYRFQPLQSDNVVKVFQHAVQIVHNVVSRIENVASVKAHADFV